MQFSGGGSVLHHTDPHMHVVYFGCLLEEEVKALFQSLLPLKQDALSKGEGETAAARIWRCKGEGGGGEGSKLRESSLVN